MTSNLIKEIRLMKKIRNIEQIYRSLETVKIEFTEKKIYLEKDYDEINQMDMRDYKEYYERDQISKNYEEKVTEDIEVLKLVN